MDDAQLAALAGVDTGAADFLMEKYKNFVRSKARSYFLIGADREDLVQEGMIGLYKAIRDFRPDKLASFRAFAELCITRQIITAIKTATRQKHIPLNSYISLSKPTAGDDTDRTLMETLTGAQNPEDIIIDRENYHDIETQLSVMLSPLEHKVLTYYLAAKSYSEISLLMGRSVKSIDNALQRVKSKLEKYINEQRNEDN